MDMINKIIDIKNKIMEKQKKDNSIYGIMKRCTSEEKLDTEKFDKMINPVEDGKCKISAAFLDKFGIDDEKRQQQVPQILKIMEDIYNDQIIFSDLENKLKEIDFKTLNIIDAVRAEISNDNYNLKTYETFKKLMYCTDNKEIFKFSIEMTALIGRCEELLDDYILIGQCEEFSKYISFILCVWREKPIFLESLFDLLAESEEWGAINYGEMLMRQDDIMSDIQNQRKVLIGTLSRNCISMEVAFELAVYLDIASLSEIALDDKDLSEALVQFYKTLFFDRQPCGGILDIDDAAGYLNIYLSYLKKSKIEESRFIGLKDIHEFLLDEKNKDEIIEIYDENTYQEIMNQADELWNSIDAIDYLHKIIKSESDYIYEAVNFIKENKIFELIPDLEEIYLKGNDCSALESLLCEFGSDNIKKYIYDRLKKEYSLRKNKEMSYNNLFGAEFKMREKIIHKMDILLWPDAHDCKLMDKLINDYNPDIRSKALEVLNKDSYYLGNNKLLSKVKERLSDSPLYVRREAVELYKNHNLRISNEEKTYILNKIREREGNDDNKINIDFENSLNEIVGMIKK